ncbi:hypothetical protein [Pseudomonas helleri]|uniref:hypothetical protein n=1 Tax=Pseudomonas helleri TaxID=1608996 RepID=UPI0021C5F244|nr:hypothetical protein [Pseudomonas helleri]MCU1756336.1 hypothetical protein [Pseudomonas helleri]
MSSLTRSDNAEQRFRQAFERLKKGTQTILPVTAQVSQNNVAKEAGCDPSALRKSRFPSLVREIQAYIEIQQVHYPSLRSLKAKQKNKRIDLKTRIIVITKQRDEAHSRLLHFQLIAQEMGEEIIALKLKLAHFESQT